jgi:uncharacterized membrane protein HdeD (DUF308 family)
VVSHMAQNWGLLVLRGVVAILFGITALLLPGITLAILVALLGAYMFVDGIIAFISAVRFRHESDRWVPLVLEGLLGIVIGLVTFFWPGITALAWAFTIAFWAIVTGVLELIIAFRLHAGLWTDLLFGLTGVASIVLGIVFVVAPLAGLLAWVWVIGVYAIVFGILFIATAVRLRTHAEPTSPGQPYHAG